MRATIYARISRDREGAALGVHAQEQDCKELAASLGFTIVSTHSDNDISAYSGKPRPGYRALLEEVRANAVDAVLTWHTDRLHRSVTELEEYAALCDAHKVGTHTVKAGHIDLATPSGRLVARQLGAVARYEVEHMIERQKRAKLRSAQAGKWKGGRRPFGYMADGVTIDEREAQAIREAAGKILAGASVLSLGRVWSAAGIKTSTGRDFQGSEVRRVLLRPRNAGLMEHAGQVIGPAEWPAILPEEQWRALVAHLTNPARRTTTGNARKWLGSGLYRCATCGETVVGTMVNGRKSYRCRRGCVSRTLVDVDDYVEAVIVGRLRRPDLADLLAAATHPDVDVSALEVRTVTLRARLDELAGLFAQGVVDARQLSQGSKEINEQMDAARKQIATAYSGTALAGIADAPDPGAAWLDAPLGIRQAILDTLATVTLLKGAAGRPKGWRPGESYFRPDLVRIEWRTTS